MISSLRLLPPFPLAAHRLNLFAPATRACFLPVTCRVPHRRGIQPNTSQSRASLGQSSAEKTAIDKLHTSEVSSLDFDIDSNWRHPRFGFTADEAPQFIYISLPRTATEDDVKALLARSAELHTAQIFMDYCFETGKPGDRCFLKIADKDKVHAAITALSRFTLLGAPLQPKQYDLEKASPAELHNMYDGWLPSPTSHPTSRVVRPPTTSPPKLLAPLMNEQWVVFKHLQVLHPNLKSSAVQAIREAAQSDMAHHLYVSFHQRDVIGITAPCLRKSNGWCCKILFGNRKDAQEAARSWRKTYDRKRQRMANIFRGGPDVHKKLWDYRQSLTDDTPKEELDVLLEMKYRELRFATDAVRQRSLDYPTPESAVGLKKGAVTSE